MAFLVFLGLPHVDDHDLLAALEAGLQLRRLHLRKALESLHHELLIGLGGRHAREG